MSLEQVLLTKWRNLPQDKQKQVLDFMDFLCWQGVPTQTVFEKRLQQIRTKITEYGKPSYSNSDVAE